MEKSSLVIAEKPSVAQAIRLAVGSHRVLALKGHFLELDFPREYNVWRAVDPKERRVLQGVEAER